MSSSDGSHSALSAPQLSHPISTSTSTSSISSSRRSRSSGSSGITSPVASVDAAPVNAATTLPTDKVTPTAHDAPLVTAPAPTSAIVAAPSHEVEATVRTPVLPAPLSQPSSALSTEVGVAREAAASPPVDRFADPLHADTRARRQQQQQKEKVRAYSTEPTITRAGRGRHGVTPLTDSAAVCGVARGEHSPTAAAPRNGKSAATQKPSDLSPRSQRMRRVDHANSSAHPPPHRQLEDATDSSLMRALQLLLASPMRAQAAATVQAMVWQLVHSAADGREGVLDKGKDEVTRVAGGVGSDGVRPASAAVARPHTRGHAPTGEGKPRPASARAHARSRSPPVARVSAVQPSPSRSRGRGADEYPLRYMAPTVSARLRGAVAGGGRGCGGGRGAAPSPRAPCNRSASRTAPRRSSAAAATPSPARARRSPSTSPAPNGPRLLTSTRAEVRAAAAAAVAPAVVVAPAVATAPRSVRRGRQPISSPPRPRSSRAERPGPAVAERTGRTPSHSLSRQPPPPRASPPRPPTSAGRPTPSTKRQTPTSSARRPASAVVSPASPAAVTAAAEDDTTLEARYWAQSNLVLQQLEKMLGEEC